MRGTGTIMGVAQDGRFEGSLSGGCIENAVVAEALDVLRADTPRLVRFGAGSPYLDIRLPCGGGIDLHFTPLGASPMPGSTLQAMQARQPVSILLERGMVRFCDVWQRHHFDAQSHSGAFGHWPAPRLQIVGHGAGVTALTRLARTLDCAVDVASPDQRIVAELCAAGIPASTLEHTSDTHLLASDPWTAFVFLFHDHDWEIDLMARALALPHFYIGAMGGRRAHAERVKALTAAGVAPSRIASIAAPIGMFHSSRDPDTLALSTLAEVIRTYAETDFEAVCG